MTQLLNSDQLAQAISAAATFRATEIVNASDLSPAQVQQYLDNYTGKYPKAIVEAGIGMVVARRMRPVTFLDRVRRVFGKKDKLTDIENKIEVAANKNLQIPGMKKAISCMIANDFVG